MKGQYPPPDPPYKIKHLIEGIEELADWLGEQTTDADVHTALKDIKDRSGKLKGHPALPPETDVPEKQATTPSSLALAGGRYSAKVIDPC